MGTATKSKSKASVKRTKAKKSRAEAKSTIHWAGLGKLHHPAKYSVKQLNNRLDFNGLELKLKKCFNMDVPLTGEMFKTHNGAIKIKFESDNLVKHAGILRSVLKELVISDWSNGIYQHENGDIILSVNVHFSWTFRQGGSNGHDLGLWAFYNFDRREWAFSEK